MIQHAAGIPFRCIPLLSGACETKRSRFSPKVGPPGIPSPWDGGDAESTCTIFPGTHRRARSAICVFFTGTKA